MVAADPIGIKIIYSTNRKFRASICTRELLDLAESGSHRAVSNNSRKRTTETAARSVAPESGCERYGDTSTTVC
jgi:hypothetical protein